MGIEDFKGFEVFWGCFYDKTAKPWYLTGVVLGSIWGHFGGREGVEVDLKLVKKWCF